MSSGADRFFDEMLETAKKAARKDVAAEVALVRKDLAEVRRDLKAALVQTKEVSKRESAVSKREDKVDKREGAIAAKCTNAQERLKWREDDIKLAEKELIAMLTMIEGIAKEEVVTTTTTARKFVKRSSKRGYYGGRIPTMKSQALSTIKSRITRLANKESVGE